VRLRRRATLFLAVILMLCFGAGTALYSQPYPLQPSVSISVPSSIDLGSVTPLGQQIINSAVKAHIAANCPYHITASIGAFTNSAGNIIPAERTKVEMMSQSSWVKGTPIGGIDVVMNLKFTIDVAFSDPAGKYTGTVILTVMAGP
jgi:hypothetical protein